MVVFDEDTSYQHNYKATTKSRAYFVAQLSREQVGEFFAAQVHAYFEDLLGFMILIESDKSRHYEQLWASEPTNDDTDYPADGQRQFRHTFEAVGQEGLIGQFFTITIQKVIPDSGLYNLYGTDFQIIPTPEYSPAFEAGFGPISAGY